MNPTDNQKTISDCIFARDEGFRDLKLYDEDGRYICTVGDIITAFIDGVRKGLGGSGNA
jgi:hypothetical protein